MLVNLAPNLPLRIQVRIKCLTSHYNLTPQLLAITEKGNTSSVHRLWLWNLNHETNKSISTSQLGLSLFSLMMMIRPWRTSSVLPADPPPSTQQSTYRWRQCSRHSPTDTAAVLIITQISHIIQSGLIKVQHNVQVWVLLLEHTGWCLSEREFSFL